MYNQTFNTSSYGGGYGGADHQQQYYYQQQQQQQYHQQQQVQKQHQQMIAGIMGYYPPEAAAMFYNPYSYGHDQSVQQYAQQQQLDYQLTPALYLLNQQAELLQKSLVKGQAKKLIDGTLNNKPQRKQRGPYKKRTNKTLSPTVSPAPEFVTDTERLSSSDLSSGNNRSTGSDVSVPTMDSSYQQQQQQPRKRKSDPCLVIDQQEHKQSRTLSHKQSIFRDVALMAVSSCTAVEQC
ncbi:LIM and SH3 domain protein Lasp-like [Anopheles moucheti]|uniref:LIM and SH3 domain protein Lasp-like n=1 Tax=Anopheles moucheti TaxID=186751 RepID=UPI0022F0A628|nr:LIM and SH3 domain protein Lasp-like [Anopheles moucheti]